MSAVSAKRSHRRSFRACDERSFGPPALESTEPALVPPAEAGGEGTCRRSAAKNGGLHCSSRGVAKNGGSIVRAAERLRMGAPLFKPRSGDSFLAPGFSRGASAQQEDESAGRRERSSIPAIPVVVINPVAFVEPDQLLLKCCLAMMGFLIGDVLRDFPKVGGTHAKRRVSPLPGKRMSGDS